MNEQKWKVEASSEQREKKHKNVEKFYRTAKGDSYWE